MKNGIYIVIGIALLFLAVYGFAYVTTSIDKRKVKKNQKKGIQSNILASSEAEDNNEPIQLQKPKAYSRQKNGTQDKVES